MFLLLKKLFIDETCARTKCWGQFTKICCTHQSTDPLSHKGPEDVRSDTADNSLAEKTGKHHPPNSPSTTPPFLSALQVTFYTSPHVAFSKTSDMVSSLHWAHLLTLTLCLMFFPLDIYVESVVSLCSVLWGVSVPLFERDIKQAWGAHGSNMIEMVIFLLSYVVSSSASHFSVDGNL